MLPRLSCPPNTHAHRRMHIALRSTHTNTHTMRCDECSRRNVVAFALALRLSQSKPINVCVHCIEYYYTKIYIYIWRWICAYMPYEMCVCVCVLACVCLHAAACRVYTVCVECVCLCVFVGFAMLCVCECARATRTR